MSVYLARTMFRQARQVTASVPRMPSVPTKFTGRMFSVQDSLPKYPVAPLEQTMEKYLQTVRPLLNDEEFQYTQKVCAEFQSGVGKELQTKLVERAKTHTNWLSDWWRNLGYLEVRIPCVINSNPGVLFPTANFKDLDGQLQYTARLIAGMLDYKVMIDEQKLPVEHLGKAPLCMSQYYQILSACRVPKLKRDEWMCYPADHPNPPRHITIMYNNNAFEVPVYGADNKPLNVTQIRAQLDNVVKQGSDQGPPVGLFTMEYRDKWAQVYENMCKDETNKATLESIHRSIIVICLDGSEGHVADPRTTFGHEMLHGGGALAHSGNRWFDKTIQFVVGRDGNSGLNYEHTTAEGPPVIHLMDHCLNYISQGADWAASSKVVPPSKLQFNLSSEVQRSLEDAKDNCDRMVEDLDLKVFTFDKFGKDFPKSQKVSPDSFIQNAIQLAYYRHHKKPCGSYESGSIRMFQLGRTDTIRSCSSASLEFTQAMMDSSVPNQRKAELLRRAIASHKQYTNDAITGKGIDRHLLGLKMTAIENNIDLPAIFKDPAYTVSGSWNISTSQVPAKSESVLFFGPVLPNGYGFCYNPQEKCILFGVSSFKSNKETVSAEYLAELVTKSLCEMRDIFDSSVKSNL